MTTVALDRAAVAARRSYLKSVVAEGGQIWAPTLFLSLDAVAAIGFAAGLAGAVQAAAAGRPLQAWLPLAACSGCARGLFTVLAARTGARGAYAAKTRLRQRVLQAALHRPAGSARTSGEFVQALVDEVETIDGQVARFLPARRAAALAPMIVLAAVALASPVSAAILFATLIPFIAALALAGGAAADQSRRQFAALARLSGLFADRLRALPLVLAFGAVDREADRLAAASREVAVRTMRVLRVAFLSSGALEFFSALSVALVAVYCGFNLLGLLPFPAPEKLDLAGAFFVLALAPEFYAPLRRLAAAYHDRQAAETAAERLSAIEAEATVSLPAEPILCPPAIHFHDVAVRYPESDRDALEGISFDVEPGRMVALLGTSGSGKTSLLHLLLGLAPLRQGVISIDSKALPVGGSIAGSVSWLGQGTLLVTGSIAENIALASPGARRQDIELAADRAGLGPMLAARPQGLDAILDARGSGLSGGERRRIGLARALLKPAPILLLDEPTAHLDMAAEAEMVETIRQAAKGRTVLVATHSEALAAIADKVVRVEASA